MPCRRNSRPFPGELVLPCCRVMHASRMAEHLSRQKCEALQRFHRASGSATAVAGWHHVTATQGRSVMTGVRVTLSEVSSIDCPPFRPHTKPEFPAGIKATQGSRTTRAAIQAACCGYPTRDTPQTQCRRWSSPVRFRHTRRRGAHNSETPRQRPGLSLVREPIPNRITSAISVNAFPGGASTSFGD